MTRELRRVLRVPDKKRRPLPAPGSHVRFQLDNGLTWVFAPLHHSPVVAVQIWVKVGSADEQPGEFGLAHLHEHMLFKGTARRGPGEIARDIEAHGGEINAWTSFDQTVYHTVLASRFFAEGIDILADAVRAPSFDKEELAREIEVVVEEIKRSMDMPSRKLSKALFGLAYGTHPYGRPVIGTTESVRSMDQAKMLAFFRKHYRPDNMVVAIAGDVTLEQARAQVEKQFDGTWGEPRRAPVERPSEPAPSALRAQVVKEDVKEAHLSLSFPIPNIDAPDLPALDALAVILGQGESSRLELGVRRARLVNDCHAYAYTPKDPGILAVDATLEPEQISGAVPALLREAFRLREELVEPAELDAAKSMLEADAIYQRETVQGLARRIGFFEAVAGGEEAEARYQQRIAALTPEQIREVARKYLDVARCSAVAMVPQDSSLDEAGFRAAIHAAHQPEPRPRKNQAPEIPFAPSLAPAGLSTGEASKVQRHVLPNGVTVLIKPEKGVPLVAVRAVLPGGLLFEGDANNGVHQLIGRTVTAGTRTRSAEDIARLSDAMAGSVSGNAGRNSVGLRGEFLSRHLERGFELFGDCLLEPSFHDEEVSRERAQQLQAIKTREDHPSGVAFRLFNRAMYGDHPYHLDQQGELSSVEKLDGAALRATHQARLRGGSLVVSLVGEVDPARGLELCRQRFGALPAEKAQRPAYPPVPAHTQPQLAHQVSQKAQAQVVYGFLGVTLDDPDRYPLEVLASVLAGQGGRLFVELRDKRSMAYSVSSFSIEGIDPGYFAVYMGTSPEKLDAAVNGIRDELEKIRETRITEAELDRARSYLVGSHAIGLQKNASRAAMIALDELYGLGAENHLQYEQRVLAVDAEAVRRVAQRFLRFDQAVLAVLGPRPPEGWDRK